MLLVACGALPFPAVSGGLTFRGPADIEPIEHLLEEIAGGVVHSVAFVIPWGAVWSLPAIAPVGQSRAASRTSSSATVSWTASSVPSASRRSEFGRRLRAQAVADR
jgi:hypothetical protein